MNKVILVGSLGKDCETRVIDNGNKVINFSVATSESYKNKSGEWVEKTDWHNVVFWRKTESKIDNHLLKGKTVAIEGKIQSRSWDSETGKKYITEIVASKVDLIGGRPEAKTTVEQTPAMESSGAVDDLPF